MTATSQSVAIESKAHGRGQFSLRSLMKWMTIVCLFCALIAVPELLAMVFIIFGVLMTGVLLLTIWKGRGWAQAFAFGAALPHVGGFVAMTTETANPVEGALVLFAFELLACLVGVGSAAYHGFLVRRQGLLPVPNVPLIRTWFSNDVPNQRLCENEQSQSADGDSK